MSNQQRPHTPGPWRNPHAVAEDFAAALKEIAYGPIGHAEASDREILEEITRIARDALNNAERRHDI